MRMLQKNISQMMTAEAMNSCSERTMTRLVIMTTYLSRETERWEARKTKTENVQMSITFISTMEERSITVKSILSQCQYPKHGKRPHSRKTSRT